MANTPGNFSDLDLRRARRALVARLRDDAFSYEHAIVEVIEEGAWQEHALAVETLAVEVVRILLDVGDEGSDELWLDRLVETIIDARAR